MNVSTAIILLIAAFVIIFILLNRNKNTKSIEMRFDIHKLITLNLKTEYKIEKHQS